MNLPAEIRIFRYLPAGLLRVVGPDAATFLQGQFTNDLSRVDLGQSAYGLWLDRKGRVVADSRVIRIADPDGYGIVATESKGTEIFVHLCAHIVADEVSVEEVTGGWSAAALVGPGAGAWLASESRPGWVFPGRRLRGEAWEWVFPESESASVEAALAHAPRLDAAEMERLRIESGLASVPRDIGPGDIPNEGGLDVEAISYSKGCYLGQEVMARIKSLGRVRRSLARVRGTGFVPALPAALWRGDQKEGELRSAVPVAGGYLGLALVSVACAGERPKLSLAAGAPPSVGFAPPT